MRSLRPFLVAVFVALPGAAFAGDTNNRFLSSDPEEVWKALDAAVTAKDDSLAVSIFEGGIAARFPDVAVGCGDALATFGPGLSKRPDFQKVLRRAVESKDSRVQVNAARVLVAWADPALDESIAYLASGRRTADV